MVMTAFRLNYSIRARSHIFSIGKQRKRETIVNKLYFNRQKLENAKCICFKHR